MKIIVSQPLSTMWGRLKIVQSLVSRELVKKTEREFLTCGALTRKRLTVINIRNVSCWKCGHESETAERQSPLQCPKCNSLQKLGGPESVNYFAIFGVQETYRIDLSKLSAEMKILQKNLHPDLFSLKTKEEQELSDTLSSLVNKAYSVLQDPMERAAYLLKLRGIDESAMEKKMTADPEFLGEVMELNERLEEIDDSHAWTKFRKENEQKMKALFKKLEQDIATENTEEAVLTLSKLKYYDNMQQKLKNVQSRLGIVD